MYYFDAFPKAQVPLLLKNIAWKVGSNVLPWCISKSTSFPVTQKSCMKPCLL